MGDRNRDYDVSLRMSILIAAIMSHAVQHAFLLVHQHGEAGIGVIEALASLGNARQEIRVLRSPPQPCL